MESHKIIGCECFGDIVLTHLNQISAAANQFLKIENVIANGSWSAGKNMVWKSPKRKALAALWIPFQDRFSSIQKLVNLFWLLFFHSCSTYFRFTGLENSLNRNQGQIWFFRKYPLLSCLNTFQNKNCNFLLSLLKCFVQKTKHPFCYLL